jgi:hypothetical protein
MVGFKVVKTTVQPRKAVTKRIVSVHPKRAGGWCKPVRTDTGSMASEPEIRCVYITDIREVGVSRICRVKA